jgi:hypothetical protein
MTYTEEQRQSILDEARETLERVIKEKPMETRYRHAEPRDSGVRYTKVVEDRVEKWKREMGELEAARELEKERMGMVQQLYQSTMKCQRDIASGLNAVNQLATAICNRLEDMSEEIETLQTRATIAEARFEDLKRSVDARPTPTAEVVDLPNPLRKLR